MKKHTQLMILIGILFCHTSLSLACDDKNGPYSPAVVIPMASRIIGNFIINTAANICGQTIMNYFKKNPVNPELANKNNVTVITYAELTQNDYVKQTSSNLPQEVTTNLDDENKEVHVGPNTHIHFNQVNETDGELLAQKIAFQSGGNYNKIERNALKPQVDLTDLTAKISDISKQAKINQPATIYINFNRDELDRTIYDKETLNKHSHLYKGTLAQALKELSKQNPNIRFITSSAPLTKEEHISYTPQTYSYYDPTKLLTNYTIFNPPASAYPAPTDYLVVNQKLHPQSPEERSLYIAYTLKKENEAHAKQNESHWLWNRWAMRPVAYKPIKKDLVHSYFDEEMNHQSNEQTKGAVKDARKTQLKNHESKSFTQKFYASLFQTASVNQRDILAEVYDKKLAREHAKNNEQNKYERKSSFTKPSDLDTLFATVPATPIHKMSPQERLEFKKKLELIDSFKN